MTIENLATVYSTQTLRGVWGYCCSWRNFLYHFFQWWTKKGKKKKNFFLLLFSFSGGVLFAFSSTMGWFISLLDGKVEFCALDSLLIIQSLKGFIRKNSEIWDECINFTYLREKTPLESRSRQTTGPAIWWGLAPMSSSSLPFHNRMTLTSIRCPPECVFGWKTWRQTLQHRCSYRGFVSETETGSSIVVCFS